MNKNKVLIIPAKSGTIEASDRWVACPVCGKQKFFHVHPSTRGRNIPVYCRKCKKEYLIDIAPEP